MPVLGHSCLCLENLAFELFLCLMKYINNPQRKQLETLTKRYNSVRYRRRLPASYLDLLRMLSSLLCFPPQPRLTIYFYVLITSHRLRWRRNPVT